MAALNFLNQLPSDGSGVDRLGVGYDVFIQVAMSHSKTLLMKVFDVDSDVMSGLEDVNTIVHLQVSLTFDQDQEFVVDKVHDNVYSVQVGCGNSKIIHLLHQKNAPPTKCSQIKARFIHRGCEADVSQNFVSMFFPKSC